MKKENIMNKIENNESFVESFKNFAELHGQCVKEGLGDRKLEDLKDEDFDFQGWLIPHISFRNMIEKLGFKFNESDKTWTMEDSNPILDSYPTILQDDGMGYGGNYGKLTSVDYDNEKNELNIWF